MEATTREDSYVHEESCTQLRSGRKTDNWTRGRSTAADESAGRHKLAEISAMKREKLVGFSLLISAERKWFDFRFVPAEGSRDHTN